MALQIISVVLFTVFFSEALTLRCYNCSISNPAETCTDMANCTSQDTYCSSITINSTIPGSVIKSCTASCANMSVNVGWTSTTSQCCASDLCNNTADSSRMKCNGCSDISCSTYKALDCKGVEDKCITVTAALNNISATLKGCASKSFCDKFNTSQQLFGYNVFNVTCCDGNMCNSAQSLTQGAVLLLVPILPILFST